MICKIISWVADQICGAEDEWEYKYSTTPDDHE